MITKFVKSLFFPHQESGASAIVNPKALTDVKISFGHKSAVYEFPKIEDEGVIQAIYDILYSYYQRHE